MFKILIGFIFTLFTVFGGVIKLFYAVSKDSDHSLDDFKKALGDLKKSLCEAARVLCLFIRKLIVWNN